jgi:hypothetical protein
MASERESPVDLQRHVDDSSAHSDQWCDTNTHIANQTMIYEYSTKHSKPVTLNYSTLRFFKKNFEAQ